MDKNDCIIFILFFELQSDWFCSPVKQQNRSVFHHLTLQTHQYTCTAHVWESFLLQDMDDKLQAIKKLPNINIEAYTFSIISTLKEIIRFCCGVKSR